MATVPGWWASAPHVTSPRLVRGVAWAAVLAVTGMLVRAEAVRPALPEGVALHRNIAYRSGGGPEARLDLYVPAAAAPAGGRPTVLAIHGGGWRGGSKRDFGPHVARLAQHGYVVAAIDYRLSRPGRASWPANLDDVRDAVRWLRVHASEYGVDPRRIAALGASAGGHLAALLGTWPDGPATRVQAVVDFYGPTDLLSLESAQPETVGSLRLMLGGRASELRERFRAASPVAHVTSDDPPMLLIHGLDDGHVPVAQSRELAAALERAGVEHRLVLVEHGRHGFVFEAAGRDLLPEILSFLRSALSDRLTLHRP